MIRLLMVFCLSISPAVESETPDIGRCPEIAICQGTFRSYQKTHHDSTHTLRSQEKDIGSLQHWNGFKPAQYNLQMLFENSSHYSGSVEIIGAVTQTTYSLAINVDRVYVDFSYENVVVGCCGAYQTRYICVQTATHFYGMDYAVITLNDTLETDEECFLRITHFRSFARKYSGNKPAVGLRITEGSDFKAISTDFGMRHARTVFPCMDHPALKARFNFSVQYPANFAAVSNTPLVDIDSKLTTTSGSSAVSTFRLTEPISTCMFGFALLEGYAVVTDSFAPSIRLLSPDSYEMQFQWILKALYEVNYYMQNTANTTIPTYPITCVVLSSARGPAVVNSYGLIFLNEASTRMIVERVADKSFLFEAILRQYLGAIVTVSDWNEVCLLEGMVQYFNELLKEYFRSDYPGQFPVENLEAVCARNGRFLTGNANETVFDATECDKHSDVFFRSLSNIFGQDIVNRLFQNLIGCYQYSTAGLNALDRELSIVASNGISSMKGYVQHHFRDPRPVEINLNFNASNHHLDIQLRKEFWSRLPIPLKIYLPSHRESLTVIMTDIQKRIYLSSDDDWFLADPDGDTCTIKLYNDEAFANLLSPTINDSYGHMSEIRRRNLLSNLCKALMNNMVVYDPKEPLSSDWRRTFRYAYDLAPTCRCCLVRQQFAVNCRDDELAECDKMPITRLL